MSSHQSKPIPYRKLNKDPSPHEPPLSYEDKLPYLNDEFMSSLSVQELFHDKRGETVRCSPHPSGISPGAACAGRRGRRYSDDSDSLAGSIRSPPSKPKGSSNEDHSKIPPLPLTESEHEDLGPLPRSSKRDASMNWKTGNSSHSLSRGASLASSISTVSEDSVPGFGNNSDNFGMVIRVPQTKPGSTGENDEPKMKSSRFQTPPTDIARKQEQQLRRGGSSSGRRGPKREARKKQEAKKKERAKARLLKQHSLSGEYDPGHDDPDVISDVESISETVSSYDCTVDESFGIQHGSADTVVARLLDEAGKSSGKKKLILKDLNLSSRLVPTDEICREPLGASLYKLSLAGNNLVVVPERLTVNLSGLRTLDLQQCKLRSLPSDWSLPNLKRLILSHNCLEDFLDEDALTGIPGLEYLDMYDNKVCEFIVPGSDVLGNLEHLNLSFNHLSQLPDELPRLKALKVLKVSNNLLTHIPELVCDMPLTELEATPNPLIQPPIEDCERGIHGMRRYYSGLIEKKNKQPSSKKKRSRRKLHKASDSKRIPPKGSPDNEKGLLHGETELQAAQLNQQNAQMLQQLNQATEQLNQQNAQLMYQLGQQTAQMNQQNAQILQQLNQQATAEMYGGGGAVAGEVVTQRSHETTINDTLKIIFVGMACTGKTTIIRRLKEGLNAKIPKREERTIGVDINEWVPKKDCAANDIDASSYDTQIIQEGRESEMKSPVDIKFSVWDFAGQNVYHATHEIFFSPHALYVLVWDTGAGNDSVRRRSKKIVDDDEGPFRLDDSSDDEVEGFLSEKEARRAERALERDIDEKVQFWVNCIQSVVPGAAILPVASFEDYFDAVENGGVEEARRRCDKMKERLLRHEKKRIQGLKQRLKALTSSKRADSQAAARLRDLLSTFKRPKLIFGGKDERDSVLRVSGNENRGFDELRKKIFNIATGREKPQRSGFPLFRGHVGSAIPRLRLQIRDFVREKRGEFKVVEWKHFLTMLKDHIGIDDAKMASIGQTSDALRFLSSIGEISFFGDCQTTQEPQGKETPLECNDDASDEHRPAEIIEPTIENTKVNVSGLSQFIFLNPKWLAAALACILRHDLKQEINETRQMIALRQDPTTSWQCVGRGGSFHEANLNCPIIKAEEACMLWEARKTILKAAERANKLDSISSSKLSAFEFLQRLLVHFKIMVPIDLNVDRARLGDHEFSTSGQETPQTEDPPSTEEPSFFFLPSLLGPGEPTDRTWTYKCNDSWKTCLCHSWLFPDGAPPGLMEHVTASVLRDIHAVAVTDCIYQGNQSSRSTVCFDYSLGDSVDSWRPGHDNGQLRFREILCWQTAFNIALGKLIEDEHGDFRESRVEVWAHLVEQDSPLCVASDSMGVGMRRLVISGKGQEGGGCKNIWKGGYDLVTKAVERVLGEYGGLEFEKEGVCPDCLATRDIRHAQTWNWTRVLDAVSEGTGKIRCGNGHHVDIRLVGGLMRGLGLPRSLSESEQSVSCSGVPFLDLCAGVVLVGLWDEELNRIVQAGSGFVVDDKRGLIVTASHTLINMESGPTFGSNYFGRRGRAVVGVIQRGGERNQRRHVGEGREAYFRYFAEIVSKDVANMDACVLRITSRMRNFVGGDGSECGRQITDALVNKADFKKENLQKLKVTKRCEYEEQVRILGYNQGGEGLVETPRLTRDVEVVNGAVIKIYKARDLWHPVQTSRNCHRPRAEIVVSSLTITIGGHSGGPCVNQAGEVIGILSRADPVDKQRCYLVPSREFIPLVRDAILFEDEW